MCELSIRKVDNVFWECGYYISPNYFYRLQMYGYSIIIDVMRTIIKNYPEEYCYDENYCRRCGTKIIFDKLSEKYGGYCPNLECARI